MKLAIRPTLLDGEILSSLAYNLTRVTNAWAPAAHAVELGHVERIPAPKGL